MKRHVTSRLTSRLTSRPSSERRAFVVATVVMALVASACGSSDTGGDGGGSDDRVVTIGVLAPIDGGLVDFGRGMRNAVELAVREANAAGVLPGWTIEVLVIDDSSDPAKGAAGAQSFVADDTVVAVIGPYNSGVALSALPVLAPAGIALVSPSNTLTDLTLGPDAAAPVRPFANYFRMVGSDAMQGEFLATQALALGYRSAAVVSETKAVSKGLADIFAAAFAAKGGTVTTRSLVPDDATDFTSFLADFARSPADLIFFGGEYPVAARLRAQATAAGIAAPVFGGDGIKDDALITEAGASAEGTFASSVGVPVEELVSAASFFAAYEAAGFGEAPSEYGPYAYDAARAVIAALATALEGVTRPSEARTGLIAALALVDLDGATGPVSFDAFGDPLAPNFTLYRVDAGSWIAQPKR